jgi:hypothetical protein
MWVVAKMKLTPLLVMSSIGLGLWNFVDHELDRAAINTAAEKAEKYGVSAETFKDALDSRYGTIPTPETDADIKAFCEQIK